MGNEYYTITKTGDGKYQVQVKGQTKIFETHKQAITFARRALKK